MSLSKDMDFIMKYYNFDENVIASKCGVNRRTVNNWRKKGTMPIRFLENLGFQAVGVKK
jgi:hypothetical protein